MILYTYMSVLRIHILDIEPQFSFVFGSSLNLSRNTLLHSLPVFVPILFSCISSPRHRCLPLSDPSTRAWGIPASSSVSDTSGLVRHGSFGETCVREAHCVLSARSGHVWSASTVSLLPTPSHSLVHSAAILRGFVAVNNSKPLKDSGREGRRALPHTEGPRP